MTLVERLMQYQVNKGIECSLLSEVEDKLIEQAQRIEELEQNDDRRTTACIKFCKDYSTEALENTVEMREENEGS